MAVISVIIASVAAYVIAGLSLLFGASWGQAALILVGSGIGLTIMLITLRLLLVSASDVKGAATTA